MRKIAVFLTSYVMLLTSFFICSAENDSTILENDIFSYYLNTFDNEIIITKCLDKTSKEITIPSEINGIKVTALYPNAFSELLAEKIIIEEGITLIGLAAFNSLPNLSEISLPSSVTSIKEPVFYACPSLNKITLSSNNPAFKIISGALFTKNGETLLSCPASLPVSKFTLPEGCIKIAPGAFAFSKISEIVLTNGLLEIEERAFVTPKIGGTKEVYIPQTAEKLSDDFLVSELAEEKPQIMPICERNSTADKYFIKNNLDYYYILPEGTINGDLNIDGVINLLDIIAIKKIFLEMSGGRPYKESEKYLDVDNNGDFALLDIIVLKKIFLEIPL